MKKKMYQVPRIKVRTMNSTSMLAASNPTIGGNTGITIGGGGTGQGGPTEADAKHFDFSFESNESSESSNLWTEE